MTTVVLDTVYLEPVGHDERAVREADLVVLRHPAGLWSIYKDRHGVTTRRVPFDGLPERVKAAVFAVAKP